MAVGGGVTIFMWRILSVSLWELNLRASCWVDYHSFHQKTAPKSNKEWDAIEHKRVLEQVSIKGARFLWHFVLVTALSRLTYQDLGKREHVKNTIMVNGFQVLKWVVVSICLIPLSIVLYCVCSNSDPPPPEWWDAVLQKRLAWALFVLLLSTLVCCQPTELIWAFLFHKFSNFTPRPWLVPLRHYSSLKFPSFYSPSLPTKPLPCRANMPEGPPEEEKKVKRKTSWAYITPVYFIVLVAFSLYFTTIRPLTQQRLWCHLPWVSRRRRLDPLRPLPSSLSSRLPPPWKRSYQQYGVCVWI